jgi:Polyketide cyclase / dehydrase and lipid transport
LKFSGHAFAELPGDAQKSWLEASTLGWLKGYDKVLLTGSPQVGATFTLVDGRVSTTCRFTRVEPPRALSWEGTDGTAGSLEFEPLGGTTRVTYHAVYVPKAGTDKLAAGLIGALARGKAQRETDKDAADELRNLSRRVKLRVSGRPVDGHAPRFMLDFCDFAAESSDLATIPAFDESGRLRLARGEQVLWTGTAILAAESAQAARGQEQFTALWSSREKAFLALTSQRLVYDIRNFTHGDMSWLIVGGATGLALTAFSAARASVRRSGRTAAGQIRHENLANLITGANARTTFASPATVTATICEPPKRLIRLHVTSDSSAEDLAQRWIRAAAAERLQRLAGSLNEYPDQHEKLLAQQLDPKPHSGYWGPFWAVPLPCMLGRDQLVT